MRYHHDSLFSAGPRRPMTRDQRRIWLAQVELHRRAGRLTALHQIVARALLSLLGDDGRLDPAHATLARLAGCCERTVREALRRLRRVGLSDWMRRLVRQRDRVRQTSNAYVLIVRDYEPLVAPARCAGRTRREGARSIALEDAMARENAARQIAAIRGWTDGR